MCFVYKHCLNFQQSSKAAILFNLINQHDFISWTTYPATHHNVYVACNMQPTSHVLFNEAVICCHYILSVVDE